MKRKSSEANVTDASISFLSTPAVRELLEGREKATGGGKFVWDKDLVADRPAYVSTDVPVATMICGRLLPRLSRLLGQRLGLGNQSV